jgi:glutamate dehydrogenase (NADP+)
MALFKQAVLEVSTSLKPLFKQSPKHLSYFELLQHPEKVHKFRVLWENDKGELEVNRGYRVQFNSALGPYKGGLRFHPSVCEDTVKFLGFEQLFKNALTGVALGGAKGGSDFDPKGKSNAEIRRFCKAFMGNLYPYIGPTIDVPAGDIGVGGREIQYMYGEWLERTSVHGGVLTGKDMLFGGSHLRPEATGFGVVYFLENMLQSKNRMVEDQRVAITGSGNVAQYAAKKVLELGGEVVSMSDSKGSLLFHNGMNLGDLYAIQKLKDKGGSLSEMQDYDLPHTTYHSKAKPWDAMLDSEKVDVVLPCATQNEVGRRDVERFQELGVRYVVEGSNMSSTPEAVDIMHNNSIEYGLGKASNLGGVGVSGLEMSQNAQRQVWSADEVDRKLKEMMQTCYQTCYKTSIAYNQPNNLVVGANIASFLKVSEAMEKQGTLY